MRLSPFVVACVLTVSLGLTVSRPGWAEVRHLPPLAGHILRFLTDELKPRIDHDFRTLSDPRNTALLGSSMGGLFAIFAAPVRPVLPAAGNRDGVDKESERAG